MRLSKRGFHLPCNHCNERSKTAAAAAHGIASPSLPPDDADAEEEEED